MNTGNPNPLIAPILSILMEHPQGISEYEIMSVLREQTNVLAEQNNLDLFHQHFYVMNALYQLQNKLYEEQIHLAVSPLCIRFEYLSRIPNSPAVTAHQNEKLKEYYLDWSNYIVTTEEDVKNMLQDFWQKYYAQDKQVAALKVFGLDVDTDWSAINHCYRRLVAIYHPDKGGDQNRFIEVIEAYEVLQHFYRL